MMRRKRHAVKRWVLLIAILLSVPLSIFAAGSSKAAAKMSNEECLACHNDATLTKDENGKQISLHVDEGAFKASIHSTFGCTDCHSDIKAFPHDPAPVMPKCATCHADEQGQYDHGIHAKAAAAGNANAAKCQDCHGNVHTILPASDPKSKVAHTNIPQTCGACHAKQLVMASSGMTTATVNDYEQSVHGRAVAGGSEKAAVCTDCHGTHEILGGNDPKSSVSKFNIPDTCAKCHADVAHKYKESIHGQQIAQGNWQAPVCTDCHGIHTIKAPSNPNSSVAAANVANTCASCHASVRLSNEFGLPTDRVKTYMASYHGMANRMGSKTAANCASCHGVHDILPSSDPRSKINPANLAATCGKCHPGANQEFIRAKVHFDGVQKADFGSKLISLISKFYIWMIVAVIGGMVLHNLIIFRKKLKLHRIGHPRILYRMNRLQRIQHLTLLISFIILVLTGFALKYPDSWLGDVFINESVRGIIHRIAGVVMICVSLYHAWYLFRNPDGRQLIKDMLPDLKDVTDIRDAMLFYLGVSDKRPMFRRFSYAEKAEYWALIWGIFVMAGTGLLIWFKMPIMHRVPGWWIDVAITIHWYEAVLATLAIIVWHFYAVIFDPDAYPMNWAWFDGKMSVEHYEHEHPLDMLAIERAQEMDEPAIEEGAKPAKEKEEASDEVGAPK